MGGEQGWFVYMESKILLEPPGGREQVDLFDLISTFTYYLNALL